MEWLWKKPWLILVGAIIVLVQVFGSSSGCFPEEKQSLLDFKAAYSNESLLPSWVGNPKSNCCDWERVTCDSSSGHVTDLSLEALNRKRHKYGYCLESSSLNWTLFLPFKELSSLDLSHNCFEGIVWKEGLCQMKQLTELHLTDNDFKGPLDACLGNLTSISTLDLSHNFLSGSIPVSIKEMSRLKILDLGHNNLSGNVPENILDGCTSLSELMLDNNQLDGTLSWIRKDPFITITECPNTSAQGLYIIDLSHNNFSGELPFSFNMPFLIFINLKGNSLTGMIPESFFDIPYLVVIDLSENNFAGAIPNSIYGLVEPLVFLLLAGNQLQGQLSPQICQLQSLQVLDLSYNNFTGSIPSCFNKMAFRDVGLNFSSVYSAHRISNIAHLRFDEEYSKRELQIKTKGLSSSYQGNMLKIMSALDLSSNQLTGEIPQEIGYLTGLHSLNLSHNHFNGHIPESFHKLEKIESLDLSYNNLSGQIPLDLQDIYTLSIFNVSYNNLSGRAPEKGQFGTFDESSYKGNPYLYWSISNRGNATPPSPLAPLGQGKKDDSTIDVTSFLWSFVASYVMTVLVLVTILWMNPYWRRTWFYYVQRCLLKCFGQFLEDTFY